MTEDEYRSAQLVIDAAGIRLGKHHIMPSDEKSFIEADARRLCEQFKPKTVLEIGFGLGLSATVFQEHGVAHHCIIEAHPVIAENARRWAEGRPGVVIVEGFAQTCAIPSGAWDLIFDDRYELVHKEFHPSRFVHAHYWACPGYDQERAA